MIEKELFSSYSVDEKKLREYGFQQEGSTLIYTQDLSAEDCNTGKKTVLSVFCPS